MYDTKVIWWKSTKQPNTKSIETRLEDVENNNKEYKTYLLYFL